MKTPKPIIMEMDFLQIEEPEVRGLEIIIKGRLPKIKGDDKSMKQFLHRIVFDNFFSGEEVNTKGNPMPVSSLIESHYYLKSEGGIFELWRYNPYVISGSCVADRSITTFKNVLADYGYETLSKLRNIGFNVIKNDFGEDESE